MKKEKMTRKERERYHDALREFRMYESRGTKITLSGDKLPLEEIARACVIREPGGYMGDYIWDDNGALSEIRYDRISEKPGKKKKNRS